MTIIAPLLLPGPALPAGRQSPAAAARRRPPRVPSRPGAVAPHRLLVRVIAAARSTGAALPAAAATTTTNAVAAAGVIRVGAVAAHGGGVRVGKEREGPQVARSLRMGRARVLGVLRQYADALGECVCECCVCV
jgi:hypothetical protein